MSDSRNEQLISWLERQGHTPDEIQKIIAKVADYDTRTIHESVFDSIDSGGIDLAEIIREALDDSDAAPDS